MGLSPRMSKGKKGESSCSVFFSYFFSSSLVFFFYPLCLVFSEAVISFCHALGELVFKGVLL